MPTLAQPPFTPAPGVTDFCTAHPRRRLAFRASQAGVYWRAAFHLWTTKLRPLWQASWWTEGPCCGKPPTTAAAEIQPAAPDERILLADLIVPLTGNPLSGDWTLTPEGR